MAELSPPAGPAARRLLQATVAVMVVAAAAAWVVAPLRQPLATVALGIAVAGPFLRLGLVAVTWRAQADRPHLAATGVLILAVALVAVLH